jgi:hypothetical protein
VVNGTTPSRWGYSSLLYMSSYGYFVQPTRVGILRGCIHWTPVV